MSDNTDPDNSSAAYERLSRDMNVALVSEELMDQSPEDMAQAFLRSYPDPDPDADLTECLFIKDLINDPSPFSPINLQTRCAAWSIMARFPDGRTTIHSLFEAKPGYDAQVLDIEIETACQAYSGPLKCWAIKSKCDFKKCHECKHFQSKKVNSPIKIRSSEYIATKGTGFWEVSLTKDGVPVPTKPNYHDLLKELLNRYPGVLNVQDLTYVYNGQFWRDIDPNMFKAFIEETMKPGPKENHRREFLSLVKVQNVKESREFDRSTDGLINMANGVFDIKNRKLIERTSDMGFKYILPYAYDETAQCPTWQAFLDDVTCGRYEIQKVLMEFIGYSLANGPCYAEKALFLYGDGENGKSTFMDTIKELAGEGNYSSLSLTALNKDTKRYMVDGKLFNIGEETNVRALGDSEVFKTMVTGGEIDVKRLYSQDYTIRNRCKLIMAANDLPKSKDRSHGLYRRMILVPFDAVFSTAKGNKDPFMRDKLKGELPGIFNLAIEMFGALQERGFIFTESDDLRLAIEEYKSENDVIVKFFRESVERTESDSDYIFKQELYSKFKRFSEDNGFSVQSINSDIFFKAIKKLIPEEDYIETRRQPPGSPGSRQWAYSKLKYKDNQIA